MGSTMLNLTLIMQVNKLNFYGIHGDEPHYLEIVTFSIPGYRQLF